MSNELIEEIRSMAKDARFNKDGTPVLTGDSLRAMSRLYVLLPQLLENLS